MNKPIQKRRLATHARLVETAEKIIASKGFGAMRVEEVVQSAGVAKGTFFAHFRDKDALMDLVIGARIDALLDEMENDPPPTGLDDLVDRLMPLLSFMSSERYVFDVIIRHSGAAAKEEIGPIAQTFDRQIGILQAWLSAGGFRSDVPALLLAEGVQAFIVQALALHFCAIHGVQPIRDRLIVYLEAWLLPATL